MNMHCRYLLFGLLLWHSHLVVGEELGFSDNRDRLVQFEIEDGVLHYVTVEREKHSPFTEDATIFMEDKVLFVKDIKQKSSLYTKLPTLEDGSWATFQFERDSNALLHGVYFSKEHGLRHFEKEKSQLGFRHLTEGEVARFLSSGVGKQVAAHKDDAEYPPNRGNRSNNHENQTDQGAHDDARDEARSARDVTKFFPNCYPGDTVTRKLTTGVAMDWGYAQTLSSLDGAEVLREIEKVSSVARIVNFAQLNVLLEVTFVLVGNARSESPLNFAPSRGNCVSDLQVHLNLAASWNSQFNANRPAGAWHLLTTCHAIPDVIGRAFIDAACDAAFNIGVSSKVGEFTWWVYAHELGHVLGATHTLQQGGVMDYGDGTYLGLVQYHPNNRAELCGALAGLVRKGCAHLTIAPLDAGCGNGLLESNEECECLDRGSQRCGACVKCKTTQECSTQDFVVRDGSLPSVVSVTPELLSSPLCCDASRGTFAPPKTQCGPGLRNVCTQLGRCVPACAAYNLDSCGFSASGCAQGCVLRSQCRFDIATVGPPPVLISNLPEGTRCFASTALGYCDQDAKCIASPTTPFATASPSSTSSPSTTTLSPSSGLPDPLPCPAASLLRFCNAAANEKECRFNKACVFCRAKRTCEASAAACVVKGGSKALFSHCAPFLSASVKTGKRKR